MSSYYSCVHILIAEKIFKEFNNILLQFPVNLRRGQHMHRNSNRDETPTCVKQILKRTQNVIK